MVSPIQRFKRSWLGKGPAFPFRFTSNGGIQTAEGIDLVKSDIFQIVGTDIGSRVMRRAAGTNAQALLFSPNTEELSRIIEFATLRAIEENEKRIIVRSINSGPANGDKSVFIVNVEFEVVKTRENGSLVFPFAPGIGFFFVF